MKIAVTGAGGLMGQELRKFLDFIPLTHKDCDVTNYNQVERVFRKIKPDITIHLAAVTTVVEASEHPRRAYQVNVEGTHNVALNSKHLIYLSTDYIFDGKKGRYKEDDVPFPQTLIGLTKLLGEERTRWAERYTIIRTSFKPIPFKHDQAPSDMYTSADYVPIIAYHLAQAVKNANKLPEVLHLGIHRRSVYDLARKTKPNIKKVKLKDLMYPLPRDCSLNTDLWKSLNLA